MAEFRDDDIPDRFLIGCQSDVEEARRRYSQTLLWRKMEKVDTILQEEQPYFSFIKKVYPHGVFKKSKQGMYIYIERPAVADIDRLFSSGIQIPDLIRHYVFITEFIWKVLDANDQSKLVTIMDVTDASLSKLVGQGMEFFIAAINLVQSHYIERSYKIFIVNAPTWFNLAWNTLTPFINQNTLDKIIVLGSDYHDVLEQEVDASNLPLFLTRDYIPPTHDEDQDDCYRDIEGVDDIGSSPEERLLRIHVDAINSGVASPVVFMANQAVDDDDDDFVDANGGTE